MTTLGLVLYIIANIGFAGRRRLHRQLSAGHLKRIECGPHLRAEVGPRLCERSGRDSSSASRWRRISSTTRRPDQLSRARLIPVVVAAYYAIAVIPTFLFLRDRSRPRTLPPGENYLTVGFRQLRQTLRHIRRYRELVKLLIAFLVYNDGVVTVIYFAALYASTTIGFSTEEIAIMFIAMNVVAAVGALSFGWIADRIGQKKTILISLTIWIAAVVLAYFSYSKASFYVVATLAGIGHGLDPVGDTQPGGAIHAKGERGGIFRLPRHRRQGACLPRPARLRHGLADHRQSASGDSFDRGLLCRRHAPALVRRRAARQRGESASGRRRRWAVRIEGEGHSAAPGGLTRQTQWSGP